MSIDNLLTKEDLRELTSTVANISKNVAVITTEVTHVKNHLAAQNGKVKTNSQNIGDLQVGLAKLEVVHQTDQKYTEKNIEKADKKIFDIIKENGNIILTIFVIISTVLSWIK